jgi:hypothetical protein
MLPQEVNCPGIVHRAKKGYVNAYEDLMDSAYGAVKQSEEITEGETPNI